MDLLTQINTLDLKFIPWQIFNLILAFLGMGLGFAFLKASGILRVILFLLWLLFIPNTIYLITDIQHFPENNFNANNLFEQTFVISTFIILIGSGILTFMLGLLPMEKFLELFLKKDITTRRIVIIFFNFLIAFAIVIGKIQRTHSLYVFTQPMRVVTDVFATLTSPYLMTLVLLTGILVNLIYYLFRRLFNRTKVFKKL